MPLLIGDQRRLQQVVINLVKNALKFTQRGSITILACYNRLHCALQVSVVDTGVGIAQIDISKLFTRFGTLKRMASINSNGIGLGLIIVKQIVE